MSASLWQPGSDPFVANADSSVQVQKFTAFEGQTAFDLTAFTYVVGVGALWVFRNGIRLDINDDFLENTTNRFNLVTAATAGEVYTAIGFVGLTGDISYTVPDIFTANHAALRVYSGAQAIQYVLGGAANLDGKEGWYQFFTGAAPATYVDDGDRIIVPDLGDGSEAWLRQTPALLRTKAGLELISQTEIEAGIATDARAVNALRIKQAIQWNITDTINTAFVEARITGATIKSLYEAEADTNAFDDAAVAVIADLTSLSTPNWTPALSNGTGESYTTQLGEYLKVGALQSFHLELKLSSKGTTTSTLRVQIAGLPLSFNTSTEIPVCCLFDNIVSNANLLGIGAYIWGGSQIRFCKYLASGTDFITEDLTYADIQDTFTVHVAHSGLIN